jgi:hypothetical protein
MQFDETTYSIEAEAGSEIFVLAASGKAQAM